MRGFCTFMALAAIIGLAVWWANRRGWNDNGDGDEW